MRKVMFLALGLVSACSAPDPCGGLAGGALHDCHQVEIQKALINYAIWSQPGPAYDYAPSRPNMGGPMNCIVAGNTSSCHYQGRSALCVSSSDGMGNGTVMCN